MTNEEIIANFLKHPTEGGAYTDEGLAALYAHVQDRKFSFVSCCCLRGAANADHALRGRMGAGTAVRQRHYEKSAEIPGALAAEAALRKLLDGDLRDELAQQIMLPLIEAEMSRRESLRGVEQSDEALLFIQ